MESANNMLDDRSKKILCAVIQCYINTPGPVGSRVVTKKYHFGLSPATIRNIMSDLEEMGYLRQPHTSAGRVPTDSGYRFYVDTLNAEKRQINAALSTELNRNFELLRRDINSFLDDASKMLSELSHYIGIAMSPKSSATTLHKIELFKYREDQLVVILLTDEGVIKNKIVSVDPELSQRELNRISEYINDRFRGHSLDEIKKLIVKEMTREKVICDKLISEAIRICRNAFSSSPGHVYISGVSGLLQLPEFCDINRIRELLQTLEDKHIIVNLLDHISDSEGTQVLIGEENPLDEMKQFSLIAATYKEGSRPIGTIAIIGPKRMNYFEAISIVDYTARFITKILS
jgi:heat-inducible transcriptional repressor